MSHVFAARPRSRVSSAAALALDSGLRVRIDAHPAQRALFSGAEGLSLHDLVTELALMVSELRVHSFALRHEIEQVTSALMRNAASGFWPLAQRAALDLGDLLRTAARRRLGGPELCLRGADSALRIADLLAEEVR